MTSRSKKYRKSIEVVELSEVNSLNDAFDKLSKFEKVNFDETIEVSCSLGVDPKQSSHAKRYS